MHNYIPVRVKKFDTERGPAIGVLWYVRDMKRHVIEWRLESKNYGMRQTLSDTISETEALVEFEQSCDNKEVHNEL